MFGLRFIKFDPKDHVIRYNKGRVVREGQGLSFLYFAPITSIVRIPLGSNDLRFVFNEVTKDFQEITIQGQLTYRINDPAKVNALLDLTVDANGRHRTDDLEKLEQRLINEARTSVSAFVQGLSVTQALTSVSEIERRIQDGLGGSPVMDLMGLNVIGINVFDVKATPELTKALEAQTREALQQDADQAIYERRNFAVEQERRIKESELNTEIAVEEKRKQIAMKTMETEMAEQDKERRIREMSMEADIAVENARKDLMDIKVTNERKEADAKGYTLKATVDQIKDLDWRTITALQGNNTQAGSNIALAFRELAENAGKIGTLNITPDLLQDLINTEQG